MPKKIISKNIKDTEKIAKDFLNKTLNTIPKDHGGNASVVALSGELGAGKTTFTQVLGKHLGIKRKVNSPTFVIMKKYKIQTPPNPPLGRGGAKYKFLFHLDAYRLKNHHELTKLGWAEIIADPKNLILIEWPENVVGVMPKKHHKIKISHTKEGHRKFEIK